MCLYIYMALSGKTEGNWASRGSENWVRLLNSFDGSFEATELKFILITIGHL